MTPRQSDASARGGTRDPEVERLVRAAADGDADAWNALVRRYVALLWRIAFHHGLNESDAADVVQNTWLRLLEHIGDVREPAYVAAWLSTTARRESLRCVADQKREVLSGDQSPFEGADPLQPSLDERLVNEEQAAQAAAALNGLPEGWRDLMSLLIQDPPPSYERIGAALGVPVGSIGPTRGRSVRRLRTILAV
jgi:RNA polymerase sigma factor (sigma-70 family)